MRHFAEFTGKTESAGHIKPLHWYAACRLVVEGGFHPDEVTPRPPFRVEKSRAREKLVFDPSVSTGGERTVLGGLKTKAVDVVVSKEGIGPVVAISFKGAGGAFRNLTNRLEEMIGECTNLHMTYPALVFGYMIVLRANRLGDRLASGESAASNDVAIDAEGRPSNAIQRIMAAMHGLAGRHGVRDEVSRYEAVSVALVSPAKGGVGEVSAAHPEPMSPLRLETFFQTLYRRYEERYVLGAPDLASATRRREWSAESPALADEYVASLGYTPRCADQG